MRLPGPPCRAVRAAPAVSAAPAGPEASAGPADTGAPGTVIRHVDVPADHPAFDGHFPGAPLLPGVMLLAEVLEALAGAPELARSLGDRPVIAAAKFLAPVRPGSALTVELRPGDGGAVAFEVRRRDGRDRAPVASGRLLPDGEGGR